MLLQKKEVPYIGVFKTQSGEEFIGKIIEETMIAFSVMSPLCMVQTETGLRFAPYMMMADPDKPINVPKPVISGFPPSKLAEQYEEVVDPKLIARVAPGTRV